MAEEELQTEEEEDEDDSGINVARISPEELQDILSRKDRTALQEVFLHVPTIDIAEAANELEMADLIFIFRNVESSYTADFFDDLSQQTKEDLIAAMTNRDLVQLINSQAADDIADTVGDMPANLASKVLRAADKDMRRDINILLKFQEGTAGALMTTEYLEFLDSFTVEATIDFIRERGRDAETIYTIFVRNSQRQFVGTVDLDDLIFANKDQTLADIMNQNVVSVTTATDQEEVGQMFRRYDLNALAVLNDDQRLVGVITIDDAVDVMTQESNEDLARMTNMEPTDKPYMEMSAWENAKKCIPWLIALLVLGTFTTLALNRLESQDVFVRLPILIAFVPMLMDTGGNAGGQTTGLMIRGLAVKEFGPKQFLKILFKELKSAFLVALTVASFVFLWLLIEQYTGIVDGIGPGLEGFNVWNGQCWTAEFASYALRNAGLVSLTMLAAIMVSKAVGTLLPMGAAAIKKDPALLSQPLLTTVMDVTTLMIYFAIAMSFHP